MLSSIFICAEAADCPITINVEHALTPEQQAWGLMQRRHLPCHHGMVFHYSRPQYVNFWMFNTFIDLSIAFLDSAGVIRDIRELQAYPHMMDHLPKYRKPADLAHLSLYDPVTLFFREHSITSPFPISYAIEMPGGWFTCHGIQVGDRVDIDETSPCAVIHRQCGQ